MHLVIKKQQKKPTTREQKTDIRHRQNVYRIRYFTNINIHFVASISFLVKLLPNSINFSKLIFFQRRYFFL